MATISKKVRKELVHAVAERYRRSSKEDKTHILDEFVRLTGYHRKHAVRVLGGRAPAEKPNAGSRPRIYDEAVYQALIVLWEASDRICGKRLRALLPLLIDALERHGHLQLEALVREKLHRVSASTIDRLLAPARSRTAQKRRNNPPAVRSQIPVRTFADWNEPIPGFMEVDLVAHCGGVASGRYNHTLVLTDIFSGWTECISFESATDTAETCEGVADGGRATACLLGPTPLQVGRPPATDALRLVPLDLRSSGTKPSRCEAPPPRRTDPSGAQGRASWYDSR